MIKLVIILLFISNLALCQIETKYVIKNIADLTGEMYANAKENSTKTCRKNISGTKIILKFESKTPEIFKDDIIYNHINIHKELAKEEWIGYSGGLVKVGKYFITDYRYKDDLKIKISDCIYIQPFEIKGDLWAIWYDLYLRYKPEIDGNVDLYKCAIRNLYKYQFINQNL